MLRNTQWDNIIIINIIIIIIIIIIIMILLSKSIYFSVLAELMLLQCLVVYICENWTAVWNI